LLRLIISRESLIHKTAFGLSSKTSLVAMLLLLLSPFCFAGQRQEYIVERRLMDRHRSHLHLLLGKLVQRRTYIAVRILYKHRSRAFLFISIDDGRPKRL